MRFHYLKPIPSPCRHVGEINWLVESDWVQLVDNAHFRRIPIAPIFVCPMRQFNLRRLNALSISVVNRSVEDNVSDLAGQFITEPAVKGAYLLRSLKNGGYIKHGDFLEIVCANPRHMIFDFSKSITGFLSLHKLVRSLG